METLETRVSPGSWFISPFCPQLKQLCKLLKELGGKKACKVDNIFSDQNFYCR